MKVFYVEAIIIKDFSTQFHNPIKVRQVILWFSGFTQPGE